MSKEVRDLKERLMTYVNDIIEAQQRVEPVQKFESFQVETASRRVLRELIESFYDVQNQQNKTVKEIRLTTDNQKKKIDLMDSVMKKIQASLSDSNTLAKRMSIIVSNLNNCYNLIVRNNASTH